MNGTGYAVTGEMLRNADFVHCTYVNDGNLKKMNKKAKIKISVG